MTLATYKKRGGTSDRGKEYEWLQCAYYALKFATSDDVSDFEMFTNNESFGDFDDVALRVKFVDGSVKIFLLQLKHTEKKKNVTVGALTSATGEFSFSKYVKSYRNILSLKNFHFIMFTNRSANFKNNTKLTFDGRNIYVKHQECVCRKLLDTTKSRNCSIFKFQSSESDDNFDFFEQFYLYVNQQSDTQLKETIADMLKQKLQCDIYTTFVDYMRGWWAGNFKLSKDDVIAKLTELVFTPMIKTINGEKCNDKTDLIAEAVLKSDLTLMRGDGAENIANIWREIQYDIKEVSFTALKYGLTTRGIGQMDDLSPEKKSKVLWYLKRAPLIIEMNDLKKVEVIATTKLLQGSRRNRKLVIIGNCTKTDFPQWKIFEDLSDLLKVDLRLKIVELFTCRLQGKAVITLKELGAYNSNMTGLFLVSHLLRIALDGNFNIGEDLEELPPAYISRKIFKILLNFNVVDALRESLILLSCTKQLETVQGKFNKRIIKISCPVSAIENSDKHYIYGTEDEFIREDIRSFVQRRFTSHHFRITDKNKLQWLESSRKIEFLEQYRMNSTDFLDESEIDHHFYSRVRILTSDTGGGKTTLFKRIKNQSPPDHLVINMNLKELSSGSIKDSMETCWDHVVETTANNLGYSDFEKDIIRNFDKNKIILLWDSYDELRYDVREDFEKCVNRFRQMGMIQWISSRNNFKHILERTFDVFATTMVPFDEKEQSCYIQERSRVNNPKIMEEFFKNINVIDNSEYLGVPLQLYILTDIFNRNPDALKTILTLTDMCHDFIDGKYTHFLEKTQSNLDFLGSFIEDSKEHRLEQYKIAALKTHMPEFFSTLRLKNSTKFLEDVSKGDFLGLIVRVDVHGNVIFDHSIFGEYLCALWCSQNPTTLQKHLYKGKYHNIKFMFDLLLAENRPIFIKILYRKYKEITSCDAVKDSMKRTPLHVICTYGQRHPILNKQTSDDLCVVNTDQAESVLVDSEDIKHAISHLLTEYDPLEKDGLFDWTVYDYADQSFCLGLIEVLAGGLNSILPSLHHYQDAATVLYYSIKLDYPNLFTAVTEIPYFEDEVGVNLLHVSAEHCRAKYLTWLLNQKVYLKYVNRSNRQKWTPLHFTSFNGDLDMLKFLREKGSVFLLREPSILSLSTAHGNQQIAEFLIECKITANEFYHHNYFTRSLTLAISRGYLNIVELLVKNGAKLYKIGKNSMNALHLAFENEQLEVAEFLLKVGMEIDDVDDNRRNSYHHAAMNNQKSVILFLLGKRAKFDTVDDDKRSPLHFAAQYGSFEVAKILIDNKIDIQCRDFHGFTPLHMAVQFGHVGILRMLIEAGADFNVPNKYKRTPLHTASSYGLPECVEILCDHGASIESEEILYQRTPLHLAAWNGHEDCVKVLIRKGAQIDAPCHFLYTPLHLAVEVDSFECCQLLVEAGASVLLRNCHDNTPLDKSDSYAISMLLLEYHSKPLHHAVLEAIPELLRRGCDINEVDEKGATRLHEAVKSIPTNHELIKTLIAKGADIMKEDRDGYIPLHCALQARYPDVETLELLLDVDDDNQTLKRRTKLGATVLHVLAQAQSDLLVDPSVYTEVLQYLLDHGAEIEAVDHEGFTPLHYAVQTGNLEIIKFFVANGCKVDKATHQRRTALHMAAVKGFVHIVEYLLTQGVMIDAEDVNGDTPLDDAFAAEHPQVFKILLTKTTKTVAIDSTNHRGRSVLHMATKQGSLDLVNFFLSKEASVDIVDHKGNTPVDDALFSKHLDIFSLLVGASSNFDVNKMNIYYKCYPLHVAATQNVEFVDFLLKRDARVDVVDDDGNTPLHVAVQTNHIEIVKLLLKYDTNATAVNITNKKDQHVLHMVATNYEYLRRDTTIKEWVKLLVQNGARTDLIDGDGNIPFDILFHEGCVVCEDLLLYSIDSFDVDKHSMSDGRTLLHFAVAGNSITMATWLLRRGASINSVDSYGNTPLHFACEQSCNMVKFLLKEYSESIDFSKTNDKGCTFLHSAVESKLDLDLIKSLVEKGVSVDATTKFGKKAIDYALHDGNVEMFLFLLKEKPETDIVNMIKSNGRTVLHMAADAGSLDLVKLCLEKGIRVNEVDKSGNTALDEAATNGHLDILELLLDKDGGVMVVNKGDRSGRTLLHMAAKTGNLDMVKLLVGKGARIDLYDEDGETAMDLALEEGHENVYQFLVLQGREER